MCPDQAPFEGLIAWFKVNQLEQRAWVTAKWAESADGFIGIFDEQGQPAPTAISGFEANIFTHKLRAQHQAILVGSTTARVDNPRLNTRNYPGPSPLRLVLDPDATLPDHLNIFSQDEHVIRLCLLPEKSFDWKIEPEMTWKDLLQSLYQEKEICKILVEGGRHTLQGLLNEGLADQIIRIQSPKVLHKGITAPTQPPGFYKEETFFCRKRQNSPFELLIKNALLRSKLAWYNIIRP